MSTLWLCLIVAFYVMQTWTESTTIVFMNNSIVVTPQNHPQLIMVQLSDINITTIQTTFSAGYVIASGAIICNDIYYAYYYDPTDTILQGILIVDLQNDSNQNVYPTKQNFHALQCNNITNNDSTQQSLYAVTSVINHNDEWIFSLDSININFESNSINVQKIATFSSNTYDLYWNGRDPLFSFNLNTNQIWASFYTQPQVIGSVVSNLTSSVSGVLIIMDITTGNIFNEYYILSSSGFIPYEMYPITVDDKGNLNGVLINDGKEYFCNLQIDLYNKTNNIIQINNQREAGYTWSNGQPFCVCKDTAYSFYGIANNPSIIMNWNVLNGTEGKSVELREYMNHPDGGAISCFP